MMVSDEEKRWLVVGIAMNKVAAPVIRNYIKQEMNTHYTNNTYCHGLTTPCTMATLTYHHVNADPNLRRLKFQNINNNLHNHGNRKNLYNYNVNSSVDLAKLFLPDYLAEFSAFDESLDMSAMLRLLGFNNPAPIFLSPNPLISIIQTSADDARENVRNKWGHCNVTEWTEVLFNDCFSKLETLVRSLGLTGGVENMALDQLSDWQTKGCQLCMGHAVDQNLLSLMQQNVQELEEKLKKTKAEQTANQEATKLQLEKHDEELKEVLEWREQQMKEKEIILEKLAALEKTLSEELLSRLQGVEADVSEVKARISQTDEKVKQLEKNVRDDVSDVKAQISQTDEKVKQLEENVRDLTVKDDRPTNSTVGPFDVKTCRSKLAEHYKRTAKVPTSVWSKKSPVDIHQIYTRLSWVKEEQTPAGSSKSKLGHYRDLFTADEKGVEPKRILVQGQTGIGKSTFVKKLAVDWAELDDEKTEGKEQKRQDDEGTSSEDDEDISSDEFENMSTDDTSSDEYEDTSGEEYEDTSGGSKDEKQNAALKKFELVLVINLKEASKCPSFKDVIRRCHIFPEEDTALVEGLLNYVTKNQEKVLLVFDSYDEYHCGSNSEIFEIFRGNKLRNCCVLITTRNSKADDLREFKDVHAEITGFSEEDKKLFMSQMLSFPETINLMNHLFFKGLLDLARVPLLLLFFCTMWKKGQSESFPENKTKLYEQIVQCVLDFSRERHSPPRFVRVQDYKEILTEIGKVALECLLKDDSVFEYDQLSAAILCDESVIIGLLQVTEYAENLRPAGMVSFIHKSIQEFLAAWYITYRCVPEGNLGGIEQHARTLEDCTALENVLQFICGLSDDGAVKVFQHFKSVRISDPTLDLSKTIPDVENETDMPLCDVTRRHWRFSFLVHSSFQEVHSKAEVLTHFFDSTGGIVLVTGQVIELFQKARLKDLTQVTHSNVFFSIPKLYDIFLVKNYSETVSTLYKLAEFLKCLHIPLRITENSEVLTLGDFLRKFQNITTCYRCIFNSIFCFRNGQFEFYITDLELSCDAHSMQFAETTRTDVPSPSITLCSAQLCLKFLRSLQCLPCQSNEPKKVLGAAIRNCQHLRRIDVGSSNDSVCDLLEQVPNPSKCSLKVYSPFLGLPLGSSHLTSVGAVKLASLLPRFNNIITLDIDFSYCCAEAMDTLIASITHKSFERLRLIGISLLTPPAAVVLGQSLPEMSSLRNLSIIIDGNVLQQDELKTLFGEFKEAMPLELLHFKIFSMVCLAPLIECLRFFPNLRHLYIGNLDKNHLFCLLQSLRFVPNLEIFIVQGNPVSNEVCCSEEANAVFSFTLKTLKELTLYGIDLTPAVAVALGRLLPEMWSLQNVVVTGLAGSVLKADEIEALFGGFNKPLPLEELYLNSFSLRGSITPLAKSFRFFPNLRELGLGELRMDEHDLRGLLENFRFIPNLKKLNLVGKPLGQAGCSTAAVNALVAALKHKTLQLLALTGINLTPAAAALLGRSIPKMSSLQELYLRGEGGSILQAEEMEALFGGFNKTMPLYVLDFSGFGVRGCVAPLIKSLRFFTNLRELYLHELDMDEQDLRALLESFRFIPSWLKVSLSGNPLSRMLTFTIRYSPFSAAVVCFDRQGDCSEEDLYYVQELFKQVMPDHVCFQ